MTKEKYIEKKYTEMSDVIIDNPYDPDSIASGIKLYLKVFKILSEIYDEGEKQGLGIVEEIKKLDK
ncbi:MAG: hypothetical protein JKY53_14675 [Flavobacteriales bacterium]|nr:hypothetical protein [Flavobacteriales bacterium]